MSVRDYNRTQTFGDCGLCNRQTRLEYDNARRRWTLMAHRGPNGKFCPASGETLNESIRSFRVVRP